MSKPQKAEPLAPGADVVSPAPGFAFRNPGRARPLKRLLALPERAFWLWSRDGARVFLREVIQDFGLGYFRRRFREDTTIHLLKSNYQGTESLSNCSIR
jgi:hypothetical protein